MLRNSLVLLDRGSLARRAMCARGPAPAPFSSDEASSGGVRVERCGNVTEMILCRPQKRNALSPGMVEALLASVHAASTDGTR